MLVSSANGKSTYDAIYLLVFRRVKNSSLVFALDLMHPNMQLVVVVLLVFCTPRMTMQRWDDSMTTPTPNGLSTSAIARATCFVRRSWTWSRRENISARRASFERPRTRRSGIYPICICSRKLPSATKHATYFEREYLETPTLPVKGTMWCSHNENTSISFTITNSSWSSWKTAPLTRSLTFSS